MKKNPACPKCYSENTTYIVYGLPPFDVNYEEEYDRKVSLGGCCLGEESPKWACQDCQNKWDYHIKRDEAYYKILKESFDSFCKQFKLKNDFLTNETSVVKLGEIAKMAEHNGRIRIMQNILSRILEIDPKNIDAHVKNAKALFLLERIDDAKDSLDKATSLDPENIWLWQKKGSMFLEGRYFDFALECFDIAIILDPNSSEFWLGKALALQGLHHDEKAVEWFDKILLDHPNNIIALNEKGFSLSRMGKKLEALDCFDKVLLMDPENVNAKVGKTMI